MIRGRQEEEGKNSYEDLAENRRTYDAHDFFDSDEEADAGGELEDDDSAGNDE
jgi:hypothetical protein